MVMPISFLDMLDSRKTLKGHKDPKSSESSSGIQTPEVAKETGRAEANGSSRSTAANGAGQGTARNRKERSDRR